MFTAGIQWDNGISRGDLVIQARAYKVTVPTVLTKGNDQELDELANRQVLGMQNVGGLSS